ncbi:tetratricopeptide repeat protein [Taibaiella chishuiensis]|uniref:Tetratricopeptide repeat protein n=2 Tax=Taibaiella chishuiensis TaxID=1434707 RepID=A0A2P8CWZ2_9BACT|nr:tetratricopeptide repeat protein [Taibaiella chishuiensis]
MVVLLLWCAGCKYTDHSIAYARLLQKRRLNFYFIFVAVMPKSLRVALVLVLGLLLSLPVAALPKNGELKYTFDFNNRCRQAYQAMIALRIADANRLLQDEQRDNPENLIPVMLANYDDCLTLLFNGNAAEYKARKANFSKRLDMLEKGDQLSPWYNYCIGSLYFQWAAVYIRFNENFSAGTAFRKSFLTLKDNRKKFPDFRYNQVLLGVEETVVGTIPDSYKWITNILGMRGDVKRGVGQIADFLNHRDGSASVLREEAIFYYCYLKFFLLSDQKAVWKYLDESDLDMRNNHLYVFLKANLALNDNKAAVAEQVLSGRSQVAGYLQAPIFDYQMGVALMQKTDEDCLGYFQRFLNKYKGNLFVKDAYQKMAYYCLSVGNLPQGIVYKNKILQSGTAQTDADKQAQRFAENVPMPNPFLLKARLLCDGGYFSQALGVLKGKRAGDFPDIADKLEFNYRYARIYTLMGQPERAIPFYEATIRTGSTRQEHYAARSALELGQIYEQEGQNDKAIASYRQCISMKNHDYKSSLDQKAKAGINRLGGKS